MSADFVRDLAKAGTDEQAVANAPAFHDFPAVNLLGRGGQREVWLLVDKQTGHRYAAQNLPWQDTRRRSMREYESIVLEPGLLHGAMGPDGGVQVLDTLIGRRLIALERRR